MQKIANVFSPLLGEISWSVKLGHGSYVTIEFGQPHLHIREPIKTTSGGRVGELLSQRKVSIVGDWHFWIQDTDWRATNGDKQCDSNSTSNEIEKVLSGIDGQRLVSAEVKSGVLELNFDLGALISIFPSQEPDLDLWTLYRFQSEHVSCRSDNSIVVGKG